MDEPVARAAAALPQFWDAAGLTAERRAYAEFQARRYPSIVRFLGESPPAAPQRTLDLGGGIGSLAVALHAAFGGTYEVADFLPTDDVTRTAQRAFGIDRSDRCDLTARPALAQIGGDYDLILFVEVLEHLLVNPLLLFREIRDHLRAGGRLFLTTPNVARVGNRLKLLRGRSIQELGRYPRDGTGVYGHVVEYTRGELDRLLGTERYRPVRARIVQQMPTRTVGVVKRFGVSVLNRPFWRRWELGDDILALYERTETPESSDARSSMV
ncbi:MAG TPA: class I SAM-dependent methyltransferase [Thermoplasmata archaeon]|nr:class I SAM-dependent methyltransferase [Thermoplasmata archaeon]